MNWKHCSCNCVSNVHKTLIIHTLANLCHCAYACITRSELILLLLLLLLLLLYSYILREQMSQILNSKTGNEISEAITAIIYIIKTL